MMIRTINAKETDNEVKGKVIRKASLTRQLLAVGGDKVRIIDVKVDRDDPTRQRTVHIFRDDEDFQNILTKVLEENRKKRDEHRGDENSALRKEIEEMKRKFEELTKVTETINTTETE